VKNIDAAFLDAGIGDMLYYSLKDNENRHIFIRQTSRTGNVCEGDILLVQICREPVKTKKAEATADIEFAGKYVVVNRLGVIGVSKKIESSEKREAFKKILEEVIETETEKSGLSDPCLGAVVRTGAAEATEEDLCKETIILLCKLNKAFTDSKHKRYGTIIYQNNDVMSEAINEIKNRYGGEIEIIENDDAIYTYDIDTKMSKLMRRVVYLRSGACLYVDNTEAMTVIDVNSGKAVSGTDKERSFLKINLEAADMIARLLRVRNLSGMILIDFISMKEPENYRTLITHIKEIVSKDPVKTVYVDTTGLGLVELTRQKKSRPLHELLRG
jgi:Ribonucleases G and E